MIYLLYLYRILHSTQFILTITEKGKNILPGRFHIVKKKKKN